MADSLIHANIDAYTSRQILKVVDESVTRAAAAREQRQARLAEQEARQARLDAERSRRAADIERQEKEDAQAANVEQPVDGRAVDRRGEAVSLLGHGVTCTPAAR